MLTAEEKQRYARNLALDNFSEENQSRLAEASVLVVGAGALGSIVATYLAGAGVGRIGIADFDTIDVSNLQRQILYSTDSLGKSKVETLAAHIRRLNPLVHVEIYQSFLKDNDLTRNLIEKYDIIVEGSDNPETKHLLEHLAMESGKPLVVGGVSQWKGQVMTVMPGHASFSELFGHGQSCSGYTPCSGGGVLGPVPGIVASLQATEVIKLIIKQGSTLTDRIITFDARDMSFRTWKIG
ncbi:MAG: HesA/MoeB/ThiF family protein [Muribaculaceae bacterium]|nr:HesA/MoeB/ThiF family protein [Muribaculaceae bacterium]